LKTCQSAPACRPASPNRGGQVVAEFGWQARLPLVAEHGGQVKSSLCAFGVAITSVTTY